MILIARFTTTETDHKIVLNTLTSHSPCSSLNIICCLDKYKWNEYEIMFLLSLQHIP